jgi:hypothetical protein
VVALARRHVAESEQQERIRLLHLPKPALLRMALQSESLTSSLFAIRHWTYPLSDELDQTKVCEEKR